MGEWWLFILLVVFLVGFVAAIGLFVWIMNGVAKETMKGLWK